MTDLHIEENVALTHNNTFGIAAYARRLWRITHDAQLAALAKLPPEQAQALLAQGFVVLGGGSNIVLTGDVQPLVLKMETRGMALVDENSTHWIVQAAAGETWHDLVTWTLQQGYPGLENLALIPGTVGASPIQNIGAYGTEVSEFIQVVETFDRTHGTLVRLDRAACAFAYRDSVFKRDIGRHVVTAVEFELPRQRALKLDYAGIPEELQAMGIIEPGFRDVAAAVIRIRQRKLPDPARLGNAGSFFKNPIVPMAIAEALQATHPAMPVFRGAGDDTRKLSAAWLIDQCGWKGHRHGDAGVSAEHALVLVNHGQATGLQVLDLARRIAASVQDRFGIAIEPEPRIIGATW